MAYVSERNPERNTKAEPGFVKRRNKISGQYAARLIEMLESPAWRALSLSGRRVIDRIEIELAHHGGNDNGRLPVTFEDFIAYGIHHNCIAPAIREAEALGFIRVTERGRGGNAEYRQPNLFLLTFAYSRTKGVEPTHDWRKIKTLEEAMAISGAARASKPRNRTRKPVAVPHPEIGGEKGKSPHPKTGSTGSLQKPGVLSISWVGPRYLRPVTTPVTDAVGPRLRYPAAKPTQPYTGHSSLPIELRMRALGLPISGAA